LGLFVIAKLHSPRSLYVTQLRLLVTSFTYPGDQKLLNIRYPSKLVKQSFMDYKYVNTWV